MRAPIFIIAAGLFSCFGAAAALTVSTENQTGPVPFTPSWTAPAGSLIAGLAPASVAGDFNQEPQAGDREVSGLTAGGDLTIQSSNTTCSPNYVTGGNAGGTELIYSLPAATNGYDLTNITVLGGWQDNGRDQQAYTVSYATVAAPGFFIPLATVDYNPSVAGGVASATRVILNDPAGNPIGTNAALVRFDFSAPASENGYTGYGAITIGGRAARNAISPPAIIPGLAQSVFPASASAGADAALVFNEIMYHPATNEAASEWIEFYNQLAVDLDISGWSVSGDIDYVFPAGTRVAGGGYILLARDPAYMMAVTGLASNVFGPFTSPLNNQGGTLNLYNNAGRLMDSVSFGTEGDWPITPDGAGPSLAKRDPDWASAPAANWQASTQSGGTPGAENFPAPVAPVTVAFNEVSGTTNSAFWVELMNYGSNAVPLGNCILHHDGATNTDYLFPPGVTVNAGAFLVLSNSTLGFIAPASGEKLFLFAPDRTNVYAGYVLKKTTRARYPDGTGTLLFPNVATPGASNSFAFHSELVINEIMYKHQAFPAASTNVPPQDNSEEWVELYNRSTNAVNLAGWELSGGISYAFTTGKILTPGAYLVVAQDPTALQTAHPAADIVGGFSGHLGGEDVIELKDPRGNVANQVHYYDGGRWPEYPDGGGSSLELRDPNADNSRAEVWAASREQDRSQWQTYTYRMTAQASTTGAPDGQWSDFVMGLLSVGECWVDDLSVIQSPSNNPVQLIANGDFENGLSGWRVLGNHRLSAVELDPDNPGNHVLHIVASGPQEHMHNHIERTLNQSVVNGQEYEISFRARWIAGNNLLNTRLYFDRVARTTALTVPQVNGTPGAVNSCYTNNIGPTFSGFQHQPVVPASGQAVSVYVQAQDPQGVTNCTVWWAVNGGAWSSAAMTLTNGMYAATIPGQPAGSLVQFYVSGQDGWGAVSTYPARGAASGAFYRVDDGAAAGAGLHTFRILMSPANVALQNATTNLMSNENLPCTIIYDERQAYYDALVRLKSSERGRVEAARIGFHVEFHPDDLFRGVHPVLLMDRSAGGSRPPDEEILIKHMLGHAGIPMINSDLCRVIAPVGNESGTAILSPRYEDRFVATAYTNGNDGTLFEYELTYYPLTADTNGYKLPAPDNVQGVDISDLGDDKERYRYNFIIKNHRNADDYTTFIHFAKQWNLNDAALDTQTRATMDVDEWLRAYALISLSGVSDMYTFGNEHNWMFYVRPGDRRLLYFPWDMDFSFTQSPAAPLVGNDNFAKVVSLPGNLRRFYAHLLDLVNTTYNATYMNPWVSYYGGKAGQNYSGDLSYITQRANYALSTITNADGNVAFSVDGPNSFSASSNLVTLTGTAPVAVTTILINGVTYPVTWTSLTTWMVSVPVSSAITVLSVQALDLHGNPVKTIARTVYYSGSVADPQASVAINEIMFAPAATNAGYVELINTATNFSFDLGGWRLNGLGYTFPAGSVLPANSYLVLAKDRLAFAAAYGEDVPVFDEFGGNLDRNGETLTLFMPDAADTNQEVVVDRVRYETNAPWPAASAGASLQLMDAARDNSRAGNWAVQNPNVPPAPHWVRVVATGVPQPTSGSRPLYLYLQSAGDIYIDDVSVVAGTVPESGANLVANSGFENALTSWTIGSDGNNSASVSSANSAHSGSSSLHLIASSGGTTKNSAIWQDFSGSLTVGATYTLSFWYLQSTNGGPLTFRFSGSGISITVDPAPEMATAAIATPGVANSVAAALPAFPPVWLNEVQPVNVAGPTNNTGSRSPWVELYNPDTNVLSLGGLYLSPTDTNLAAWAFPSNVVVSGNGFLVVWCDGQTNQSTATAPHTSFVLPPTAGGIRISRLLNGNVPQVVDYLNYANLPANWSYGDYPDGQPFYRQSMFVSTAGVTNSAAGVPLSVRINEWMASNTHTLADPVGGKFEDWFELYNYGSNTVDLGGYYLTDDTSDKTKFQIPDTHQYLVPPQGFFLVWADGLDASNSINRAELHVSFKLSASGEEIGLFGTGGSQIDAVAFGAQTSDVSEGRFPDGALNIFPMSLTTPGTNNIIPNTAPVLAAITDKYVHVGQTVQFTATASDAESATQTLTYSLGNAPAGAGINSATGEFSWTTPNAPVPSTNIIGVQVMDNGVPPLSDTKSFTVYVSGPPQLAAVSLAGGQTMQISFGTLTGQNYQVQYKGHLSDPVWQSLVVVPGTGASVVVHDDLSASAARFYRVLVLP
ncbi:MAG TPA: lamin tail domain-containing protein [Dongiaceae bacterium]|nr:lamin tail domain-containing protein [Dongiaceae bacterium]